MSANTQFFCRQPRALELIHDYKEVSSFTKPTSECRSAIYSSNGKFLAYTQPHEVVIVQTNNGSEVARLQIQDVFDIIISPNGTFIASWAKPYQIDKESGVWNNNVKVFNVKSGDVVLEWSNRHQGGWKPQFTVDEKLMAKTANSKEIYFYEILAQAPLDLKKPNYKYVASNTIGAWQLSPGLNPSVAVFIPEKSGQPASVFIFNIPSFSQPICQKKFFKAERCQLQWNSLGTALLALASTDHDTSNKSYYGETNLYLLGIAGSYDQRIHLDKEGPIHDITWSPSSREFGVVYGYMPAKTTFFDARGNSIYSLPLSPRNTIRFSPHAKFVLVAGFGNLQGTVDVYDRQNKFSKVTTFEAPNTSVCEWSPCGRFILTATTSPRLRVDNGCKIWHASGALIYLKDYQELNSVGWCPQNVSEFPPMKILEPAPAPQPSAKAWLEAKAQKSGIVAGGAPKPAGAYRPPHARNGGSVARTSLHQLEQRRGPVSNVPGSVPGSTPASSIPGATIPGAAVNTTTESKSALKNRKKREAKKQGTHQESSTSPSPSTAADKKAPAAPTAAVKTTETNGGAVIGGVFSLEEKKIRSLLKKLRAIETLKMKQANGETLEDTQVSKIQKEDEIRKELESLGWSD